MPENTEEKMQRAEHNRVPHRSGDGGVPEVPEGGARIRVHYSGALYSDQKATHVRIRHNSGQTVEKPISRRYEVSGVIDKVCNKSGSSLQSGDRVIVYPEEENEHHTEEGFAEYIIVKQVINIVLLHPDLTLQIAALLPCGALLAYAAVKSVKLFIEQKLSLANAENPTNILIVGGGGLGLWTLKMCQYLIGDTCSDRIHITVADVSIEKLMVCKDHGCYDVVHWNDSIHEEYILERTKDVCKGGVDISIDYVNSPRTINRLTKVLKQEGVIVIGGESKYDINICLNTLASKNQCVIGVKGGSRQHLQELADIMATGKVTPPPFSIFPLDQANKALGQLQECQITTKPVLEMLPENKQ